MADASPVAILGAGISGKMVFFFRFFIFGSINHAILIFISFLGLFAARVLQHYGIEVVVLEARDRTGGRTFTQTVRFFFALPFF